MKKLVEDLAKWLWKRHPVGCASGFIPWDELTQDFQEDIKDSYRQEAREIIKMVEVHK